MKKLITILPLISLLTVFGKNSGAVSKSPESATKANSFDSRVERLFFKTDMSNKSASLIDSLKGKELSYKKPETMTTFFFGGSFWTHEFDFIQSPDPLIKFDKGSIQVMVNGYDQVNDVTVEFLYDTRQEAVNGFADLFDYFTVDGVRHYLYHGKEIMEEAQFESKSSKKYPHITFKLIDNKDTVDGKYKIRLSLS